MQLFTGPRLSPVIVLGALFLSCAAVSAAEEFQKSFLGGESGEPMLTLTSPDAAKYAKTTPEGYLFTLPASPAPLAPVGLLTQFRVRGDFEISASYEIVEIDPPTSGYGCGASLFVMCGSREGATVARFSLPKTGDVIATDRMSPDGVKRDKHDVKTMTARSQSGKLRLVREGRTLKYLMAEGDGDFQEVRRENFVKSDLTTIRLAADTGLSTGKLVVRFGDFSVRAKALPLGPATEDEAQEYLALWVGGSVLLAAAGAVAIVVLRKKTPGGATVQQA